MFSGGIASWATVRRVVERHGTADLTLLFLDTLVEDADLYRFLDEAAADIGVPVTRVAEGRDIWQVFADERFLGNSRIDPCSRVLKREQSRKWLDEHYEPSSTVVYLGFDWTELHRLDRARKAWSPWSIESPLVEPPYRIRAELFADLEARGIRRPRLYDLGLSHNNCGGGCVKAGKGHFAQLLAVFPARYLEWERNEEKVRQGLDRDVSILADEHETGSTTLTLRTFRQRLEAGGSVPLWDIGGCNCFEDVNDALPDP